MIKKVILNVSFFLISIVLDQVLDPTSHLQLLKYALAAYAVTALTYNLCSMKIKKENKVVAGIGILILTMYGILLLDTYYIHALSWFPGIVRYAIFSAYLPISLIFIIPGICLCYLKK